VSRPVDRQNGFDGLAYKTQQIDYADPLWGHLYPFRGKSDDYLKARYWGGPACALFTKRLEKGRFV